jgi:hypothetical protein
VLTHDVTPLPQEAEDLLNGERKSATVPKHLVRELVGDLVCVQDLRDETADVVSAERLESDGNPSDLAGKPPGQSY